MDKSLLKIKNKIKSAISFNKINPHNHWKNLLCIFSVIIILLIIFSLFFLYKIKNQQIFQIHPQTNGASNLVDDKLLERVNESFNTKLIKSKGIENGDYFYKDPSIK